MASKKVKKKVKNKKLKRTLKIKKSQINGLDCITDINGCQSTHDFSQIRENYFNYLQNVIKENVDSLDSGNLTSEALERISLEVEQQALLACMQSHIYQRIMVKIIHEIRKSTQKMKLHVGIKNVMLSRSLEVNEVLLRLKKEGQSDQNGVTESAGVTEVYSQIPTISNFRANYNEYDNDWSNGNVLEDEYGSHVTPVNNFNCENDVFQDTNDNESLLRCEAQDLMHTAYSSSAEEQYLPACCNSPQFASSAMLSAEKTNMNGAMLGAKANGDYFCQNLVPLTTSHSEDNPRNSGFESVVNETKSSENSQPMEASPTNTQELDPISKSRNQLQKSVENSLKTLNEIKEQQKEERERAHIAKILEDNFDEEIDDNQYDSLSDNCDDVVAEANETDDRNENLLADRLEEMRQIFGVEDDADEKISKDHGSSCEDVELGKRVRRRRVNKHVHIWYHERVIQMHKLSILASEMTEEMRSRNRSLFIEFFGEDSDEENEIDFYGNDRFLTSCKERISSWVVKYLMPFYHKKRIIGRNVFKCLGHHVSNSIIEQIQYPDEWTVKYFVTKFFPSDKRFVDESDVSNFCIE